MTETLNAIISLFSKNPESKKLYECMNCTEEEREEFMRQTSFDETIPDSDLKSLMQGCHYKLFHYAIELFENATMETMTNFKQHELVCHYLKKRMDKISIPCAPTAC